MDKPLDPEVVQKLRDFLDYEHSQNGWRDRLNAKVGDAITHSLAARSAAEKAVNEVLEVRKELQDHMIDEERHRTHVISALSKYDEWKRHIDSDIDELQEKEEVTGVMNRDQLLNKLKEEREQLKEVKDNHTAVKRALWGIAAAIVVAVLSGGATYAIKGIVATNTVQNQK